MEKENSYYNQNKLYKEILKMEKTKKQQEEFFNQARRFMYNSMFGMNTYDVFSVREFYKNLYNEIKIKEDPKVMNKVFKTKEIKIGKLKRKITICILHFDNDNKNQLNLDKI